LDRRHCPWIIDKYGASADAPAEEAEEKRPAKRRRVDDA
jgi:hypothetical protein